MEGGKRVFKFVCLQPGCHTALSKTSSSTTLSYHFKAKHHEAYVEKRKGVDRPAPAQSMIQTSLDMAPVPKAKCDKIQRALLEWLIADLLPFSTLDSVHFKAVVKSFIPNLAPPCAATIRASLLDHRITMTERLKDLMDRTLVSGAITVDGWSSRSHKSYLGITLHWLDEDFRMMECALDMAPQPHPHTAANTARLIRK